MAQLTEILDHCGKGDAENFVGIVENSNPDQRSMESNMFLALMLFHCPTSPEPYPALSKEFEVMAIPNFLHAFLLKQGTTEHALIMKDISVWRNGYNAVSCSGFTNQENDKTATEIIKQAEIPEFVAVESFRLQVQPKMTRGEAVKFLMALRARAIQKSLAHPERLVAVLYTLKSKILDLSAQSTSVPVIRGSLRRNEVQAKNIDGLRFCFEDTLTKLNSVNEIDKTLTQSDLLKIPSITAKNSRLNATKPGDLYSTREKQLVDVLLYRMDAQNSKVNIKVSQGIADMSQQQVDAIIAKILQSPGSVQDLEGPAFIVEASKAQKYKNDGIAKKQEALLLNRLAQTPGVEFVQEFVRPKK
jgi:hypothetical protein